MAVKTPSSYHQVGDGVGAWGHLLAHAMVRHLSHTQHPFLLEDPVGQGHSQLVISSLGVPEIETSELVFSATALALLARLAHRGRIQLG